MMDLNENLNAIINNENKTNKEYINILNDYLSKIELNLTQWLVRFNWSKEELLNKHKNQNDLLECPYNKAHNKISLKNYVKHIERCHLKSLDYSSADLIDYFKLPNVESSYQINTSDDLKLYKHLSQQAKLDSYKKAIEISKQIGYPIDSNWNEQTFLIDSDKNKNNKKSFKDDKNQGRKSRPKYRTSKTKSYTEVIRDLIESQMSLLVNEQNVNVDEIRNINNDNYKKRRRSHDQHHQQDHHKTKR